MSCGDEAGHGILKTRDQPNSWGKCTISRWVFEKYAKFHWKFTEKVGKICANFTGPRGLFCKVLYETEVQSTRVSTP